MIDTESNPGAWADAIAHSPCLRVETFGAIEQALAELGSEDGARICEPGRFVVWRENGRACLEVKGSQ